MKEKSYRWTIWKLIIGCFFYKSINETSIFQFTNLSLAHINYCFIDEVDLSVDYRKVLNVHSIHNFKNERFIYIVSKRENWIYTCNRTF